MTGLRWKGTACLLAVLLFGFLTANNFISEELRLASPVLPDGGLRLGLDLRGGIHWVLGVKLEEAEAQELGYWGDTAEAVAEERGEFAVEEVILQDGRELRLRVAREDQLAALERWAERSGALDEAGGGDRERVYTLSDVAREDARRRGMEQVLEVLRRRISDPEKGIPDSVVTRQGSDRVLVQIPGGQISRDRARELLEVTGHLQFKIVRDSDSNEELLRAKYPEGLPPGTVIGNEHDKETDRVLVSYLLPAQADLTGEYLKDARLDFDTRQRPRVSFTFNTEGARRFSDLTGDNVGELLAIVIDDRVYSAPAIRSRIGASGVIEGRYTSQEAADLAVVLRSGSLPIPVEIEEERTVGPALGRESIDRGLRASLLGLIVIVGFVVGYYRLSGGYASLALLANLLLLMGLMSMAEATLTLPGIAGIVLTVGMAVDANVIIFERIREELRSGKVVKAAIATGFNKAFWTILDANITTFITALVLYEFGTGPIKGFAVTLSIGILTSVFSALVLTRLMFAIRPGNRPIEALSI